MIVAPTAEINRGIIDCPGTASSPHKILWEPARAACEAVGMSRDDPPLAIGSISKQLDWFYSEPAGSRIDRKMLHLPLTFLKLLKTFFIGASASMGPKWQLRCWSGFREKSDIPRS
jgi:hypothetical protein